MAKGQKTPVEKIAEITELREKGRTINEISEETGISKTTVTRICSRLGLSETKKEPAPKTDAGENKNSNIIIPENPENVKPPKKNSFKKEIPEAVKEACLRMRNELLGEAENIRKKIDEINEFLMRGE